LRENPALAAGVAEPCDAACDRGFAFPVHRSACTVRDMRSTLALLSVAAVSSLLACGAPAAAPHAGRDAAEGAGSGAGESAASRCLAIAGAKRERKPDEPSKITVKHVLVKYAGAKRAPASVTRTREEACLRAQEARAKLEKGASFGEVVATYSEEPGAASREGSLGAVQRADVAPAFADAAFELRAGEVSHVVETDFGFHVILRTE
jgi:NIMA-interacting peptidyl-prolyl cis-trans isomerase 1